MRKNSTYLALSMAVVLAGLAAVLYLQIKDSAAAADERASNQRQIQVLSATVCEAARQGSKADLRKELDDEGSIKVSANCQRVVSLIEEDLIYDGTVIKHRP